MDSWADMVEYGDDNLDDIPIQWLEDDSGSDNTDIEEQLLDDAVVGSSIPGRSWAQVAAEELAGSSYENSKEANKDWAEPASLPCAEDSASSLPFGGTQGKSPREGQDAAVAGDPIGIRAVQSILMSATQMNLSHFHTAGMDTAGAASNVMPSAAEAMDSVYTKINTSMRFETSADIKNIRKHIVGANLGHFVTTIGSSLTDLPKRENIWYEALRVPMHNDVLRFYIDYKKMQNHGMTLRLLAQEAFGDDCSWRVSPDFMGMIDIEASGMHMSPWLSRMGQCVCGTPNILSCDVLSARRHSDKELCESSLSTPSAGLGAKAVVTRGTNVCAVSRIPEVDKRTIVSNNVTEVERMFGIEAAASMLNKLIGQRIVSDFMTRTGAVLPFHKRDEIKAKGLLTCMGFERPKDDIRAAVISNSKIQKIKNVHPFGLYPRSPFGGAPLRAETRAKEGISHAKGLQSTGARGKGTYEAIMTGVDPFMGFDIIT